MCPLLWGSLFGTKDCQKFQSIGYWQKAPTQEVPLSGGQKPVSK